MSHVWPQTLPKVAPTTAVVDYSGRLSTNDLQALNSLATSKHFNAHVVVLNLSDKTIDTQQLGLDIARSWNIGPNGFLLVVNTNNNSAAMVAGRELAARGVTDKFITEVTLPRHFEKFYNQSNLVRAISSTMDNVEQRLNVAALQNSKLTTNGTRSSTTVARSAHHGRSGGSVGSTVMFFFVIFVGLMLMFGRSSSAGRRGQLNRHRMWESDEVIGTDIDRLDRALGHKADLDQVPMAEFAKRAKLSSATRDNIAAMRAPGSSMSSASNLSATSAFSGATDGDQLARQVGDYGQKMVAGNETAESQIVANERRERAHPKPAMKLIFEPSAAKSDASDSESNFMDEPDLPPPATHDLDYTTFSTPVMPSAAISELGSTEYQPPVYQPYTFPEDEVVVPAVPTYESVNAEPVKVVEPAVHPVIEPSISEDAPLWQPPAPYKLPPAPVVAYSSTPANHYSSSMGSDFTDVLNRGSVTYTSQQQAGFMTTGTASGGESPAANAAFCPQCKSEKSPDFSFCLRCGHMFV